jgi:hypothetical protein
MSHQSIIWRQTKFGARSRNPKVRSAKLGLFWMVDKTAFLIKCWGTKFLTVRWDENVYLDLRQGIVKGEVSLYS